MALLTQELADFAAATRFESLPSEVIHESKRVLLDSIGCALAAVDHHKGAIGVAFGQLLGGDGKEATIVGTRHQASIFGAAFANSELINALDFDAILPPGHVTPYVLPVVLAVAEGVGASGKDVVVANAVAHEMSFRMGKAMDYLRDTKDGEVDPPSVFGYSSTIFGASAAASRLRRLPAETIANALGIAAAISPVNAHWPWFKHVPTSTIKYQLGGQVTQSALTASFMAELGHRGDLQILDDQEFGYARFIGTRRWDADRIVEGLGTNWGFPQSMAYKPYPHCRVMHAVMGAMTRLLDEQAIRVEEIEGIKVWVEGFVQEPAWLNQQIDRVHDAQFSIAHGVSFAAHRIPPGKAWQDPSLVFSPSVMELMRKIEHEVHPDYVKLRTANPAAQPARVEVRARGRIFVGEQLFPKGVRSPDPSSYMTDDELIAKYRTNATGVLADVVAEQIAESVFNLEDVADFRALMRQMAVADNGNLAQAAE